MICKKPFRQGMLTYGCGQCNCCRFNRRRLWTHRLMLEAGKHSASCFITLTYKYLCYRGTDEKSGSLFKEHYQDFVKRLRQQLGSRKIRYYFVGEYGDQTQRPHYHAAIFGIGPEYAPLIERTWGLGHTHTGDLNQNSAQYIAGYIVKKMTKKNDPRLGDRYPEFAQPSLKPGIGAGAMKDLADALLTEQGANHLIATGDVPTQLRHNGKKLPLGRYLRKKLRQQMGFINENAQEGWTLKASQEVCLLLEKTEKETGSRKEANKKIQSEEKQKILNYESKQKIFSKKGCI